MVERPLHGADMIGYIKGRIVLIENSEMIVEAGQSGVGYRLYMSARNLEGLSEGDEIELHVYTQVREDAIELYGFRTREERSLFTMLISAKGVGAKMGQAILNALTPADIQTAVLTGNAATLKKVPGVGPKVASQIILDLENKLRTCQFSPSLPETQRVRPSAGAHSDTRSALKNFGFSDAQIDHVLEKMDESGEKLDVQGEIRWALKNMQNT